MAKVGIPSLTHSRNIFASVFPQGSSKPLSKNHQYQPVANALLDDIKASLYQQLRILLGIGDDGFFYGIEKSSTDGATYTTSYLNSQPIHDVRQPSTADNTAQKTKYSELELWPSLKQWSLRIGPHALKRALALVIDRLITDFVTWAYAGCYSGEIELHLQFWVNHVLSGVVAQVLTTINAHSPDGRPKKQSDIQILEPHKWRDIALAKFGALRVEELFDVIVAWDDSANSIDELKLFATNPATRSYLTYNFINTLQIRLLHPGASTLEILQLYISIIRAFRKLDSRGVLLDRVARKVRRYLKDRDDTVKVIVTGLLSDPIEENDNSNGSDPDVLRELAIELKSHNNVNGGTDAGEFDWDNMDWEPDPVDAAPDYLKSKNIDVVGNLISLFESKDVFLRELQATLSDRLLRNKLDFDQEIIVLEHLKIRFGDSALQACEIMLRDVLDSRKVDTIIRRDQGMQNGHGQAIQQGVQLHAKILSRLFWPTIVDQPFKVPATVQKQQQNYEKGFEALKQSRKLTWINNTGQVEIDLELADRSFSEEVTPWQASVIYAFNGNSSQPVSRSIDQLASALEMSPTLVKLACIFWTSKRILIETERDTFTVLEKLPEGDDAMMEDLAGRDTIAAAAAAELAASQAAKELEEKERTEKMAMYHQFVVSMLTNQGAMPLPRIAMMLGIVVPGGFPFSNEELKEFLGGMVKDGVLTLGNGGAYKIAS